MDLSLIVEQTLASDNKCDISKHYHSRKRRFDERSRAHIVAKQGRPSMKAKEAL